MKNLVIDRILPPPQRKISNSPKGGVHWVNRAFSDQASERRSEA